MYSEKNSLSELLNVPSVSSFLEQYAPEMLDSQARDYISAMTIGQLRGVLPETMQPLLTAVLDLANGKEPSVKIVDPHTVPATIQAGLFSETYNVDDVDGLVYMLDHELGGCVLMRFSKNMRDDCPGRVTFEGQERPIVFKREVMMGGGLVLGVFVRDVFTEYDKAYTLHVEGFVDEDGLAIEPQDIVIRTDPEGVADPAYAQTEAVALEAAREGIVLLRNNGVLPLADRSVEVYGGQEFRISAVGAGKINPRWAVRLTKGLQSQGFAIVPEAETAILVISRASGENYDNNAYKGEFYLTDAEEQQLSALKAAGRRIVAVVNSGYPMDVRWAETYEVDALLWCGFGGMFGGQALAEVLSGVVNPSGKLPDTWSLDYYDIPAAKNFYQPKTPAEALDADHDVWVDTCYEEDIYVGYRYFETFEKPVAYPFGYGLSYTNFTVEADPAEGSLSGEALSFCVNVTNTGSVPGKEVVQIYAAVPDGKLEQSAKRLIAFIKTGEIAPGHAEKHVLTVPVKRLESYDEEAAAWILEAGSYRFLAGNSVKDLKPCGSLELKEERVLAETVNRCVPNIPFRRLSKRDTWFPEGEHSGIKDIHELAPRAVRAHIKECNVPDVPEADAWTVPEMARLAVCANSGWGMHQKGEAGKIFRVEGKDLPYYAVADGNSGVNVNRKNVGMPSSNIVCASWNTDLAYRVGEAIAVEAKDNEIRMILAPAMNLHRNPLCGRHPEYFSEDPLLAGLMAGHQCRGLEENGVDGSVKHVACNNSESTRKRNQTIASERALRELYFKAFEYALTVHQPASIMTGYNALNGVFTAEDEELLQGIFREEFGFGGFVMTDWNSYDTADIPTAIQAGNCWMTPGTEDDTFTAVIEKGVADGRISVDRLRNNTRYILHIIRKQ